MKVKVLTEYFIEFDYVNSKYQTSHKKIEVLGFVFGKT